MLMYIFVILIMGWWVLGFQLFDPEPGPITCFPYDPVDKPRTFFHYSLCKYSIYHIICFVLISLSAKSFTAYVHCFIVSSPTRNKVSSYFILCPGMFYPQLATTRISYDLSVSIPEYKRQLAEESQKYAEVKRLLYQ